MEKNYFFIYFEQSDLLLTEPIAFASNEWISHPQDIGPNFHFVIDSEGLHDYLVNNSNLPLMSPRMKAVLKSAKGAEKARWCQVDVIDRKGRAWPYFIPFFNQAEELLNREKSQVEGGILVKAIFDRSLINEMDFFPAEPGDEIRLVVSEAVKEAFERAGLTGIAFKPATVI